MIQVGPPPSSSPKRKEAVGWRGILTSLLGHVIFVLLAIFVFLRFIQPPKQDPLDFMPGGGGGGNEGQTANKVQTQIRRSMATTTDTRRVMVNSAASFSLPDNEDMVPDAQMPQMESVALSSGTGGGGGGGHGGGLGTGTGVGSGPGSGPGKSGGFLNPFGRTTFEQGTMPGYFYDFKQTKDGKPIPNYDTQRYEDYTTKLDDIQKNGFRESAFRKYFRAPDPLYLTQIAVPTSDAARGPSFFGVGDKVRPAGWLVHYSGQVAVNRDITFRFVGAADDVLAVFVNGHPKMIATWPGVRNLIQGKWQPKEPLDEAAPTPVEHCPVTCGEWITMRRGELMTFDIGIGECPGGLVGFVLMVEEKDHVYAKQKNGAKLLPLFTTEEITAEAKDRILKDFQHWEFDWENVQVFPVQKKTADGL